MKSSGISRCVDELGRIVIPKEMRRKMDITTETPLEIHLEGDAIVMKKDTSVCVFCGSSDTVREFKGKMLCEQCHNELRA
ncbi:MAG: AbrB/MazE/SpoVT family DNA-binding domain-containing protein [Clostridia bacterium]|nr:AbrB/MazE/SpoVT family DNA-binding domain-containing protein [Clostridia bacterium]